jgi:Tubulin-tyrosine ligase family
MPYLLDGYKATLRVYVLVTSMDPLRVHVFPNGLVRMCSKKYVHGAYDDLFVHLDRYVCDGWGISDTGVVVRGKVSG